MPTASETIAEEEKKQTGRPPLGPPEARKFDPLVIHVSGVPDGVDEDIMRKLFEPFGKIVDIRLMFTNAGMFKGYAYVQYEKEEEAAAVLEHQKNTEVDPANSIKVGETRLAVQYALALRGGKQPTKLYVRHVSVTHLKAN